MSRYALGRDYHKVLRGRLQKVADRFVESRRNTWQDIDKKGNLLRRTMGIASLGGATLDNEENYLIKKLFAAGLGMVCISNQARI